MPPMSSEELAELRSRAPQTCGDCGARVTANYCKECDQQFTAGHFPDCPTLSSDLLFSNEHSLHLTYL